jgi:hypothetical protein
MGKAPPAVPYITEIYDSGAWPEFVKIRAAMRAWAYWVHDNITMILFGLVVCLLFVAWLVFEAIRSHSSRDEIFRLRQRLYELEREKAGRTLGDGPPVLASRWINVGGAATTSDGGCLILLEAVSPFQKRALMTVRVDGYPAKKNEPIVVGQRLEVQGKSGTYLVELHGTEKNQARLAVSLRNRHVEYAEPV